MTFNNVIEVSRNIYEHLMDAESKYIYKERLLFSLTGDIKHAHNLVRTTEEGSRFSKLIEERTGLYIWGAGIWGKELVRVWQGNWKGFLDNDSSKWGTFIEGIPVLNPADIMEDLTRQGVKILISSRLFYKDIYAELINLGIPDESIINMGKILDDLAEKQYFTLKEMPHEENEVFADVGSLDAMSALRFIKWSGNQFEKIYCFEPDIQNIPKCKNNLRAYIGNGQNKVELVTKGAWSQRGKLSFMSKGNGASKIDMLDIGAAAEHSVEVISLDEIFSNQRITFIKMDIEGAEMEALKGCKKLIAQQKPKLAICVYHKPEDIFTLPEIILKYNPDYKLYLRHYSVAAAETVLYAL